MWLTLFYINTGERKRNDVLGEKKVKGGQPTTTRTSSMKTKQELTDEYGPEYANAMRRYELKKKQKQSPAVVYNEAKLSKDVIAFLAPLCRRVWKPDAYTYPGIPDIMAVLRNGVFLALELKDHYAKWPPRPSYDDKGQPKGRFRTYVMQQAWLADLSGHNVIAAFVTSVDEVRAIVSQATDSQKSQSCG